MDYDQLRRELTALLNRLNVDNHMNTPDYILAGFVIEVLMGYHDTLEQNRAWHRWPTLGESLRATLCQNPCPACTPTATEGA